MPLFTQQNRRPKRKVKLFVRLKGLFKPGSSVNGAISLKHQASIMLIRSIIIIIIGVSWWIAAPQLFFVILPQFTVYNNLLTRTGNTANDVYQIWQVIPEILLFTFAPFWTGGVFDKIFGNEVLQKVF